MTAADERCRLFTPDLAAALGAAAAQAHGAALRSGVSEPQLDRVEQRAEAAAASVACGSRDIAVAAARVRTAFDGYSHLQSMTFQGDTAGWQADRSISRDYTMWRLSQSQPFGWNSLVFGLAGRGDSAGLVAVASFPDGARPYSARLILRDTQRAPQPFLNLIRVSNTGRLPLDARMPPADATRAFFPEARADADQTLLPRGASSGVAFRFPMAAADAIARLDPREAVAIEFLFADGGQGAARTAYVEVGDFAAGRAFLTSAR
ncbi:MAG: hypothetical protein JO303_06605 [Caulobacteraceae bacterium]|nr:hypothetical protein [Caulobacteraceae bacterium]